MAYTKMTARMNGVVVCEFRFQASGEEVKNLLKMMRLQPASLLLELDISEQEGALPIAEPLMAIEAIRQVNTEMNKAALKQMGENWP